MVLYVVFYPSVTLPGLVLSCVLPCICDVLRILFRTDKSQLPDSFIIVVRLKADLGAGTDVGISFFLHPPTFSHSHPCTYILAPTPYASPGAKMRVIALTSFIPIHSHCHMGESGIF